MATRFDTPAEVTNGVLIDTFESRVFWQSEIKCSGNGAIRFNVLNGDSSNSGNWRHYLANDQRRFGNGSEYYVQYRYYCDEKMWRYKAVGDGPKVSILSDYLESNTTNEVVIQNVLNRAFFQLYWQNGSDFVGAEETRNTPCNSGNKSFQNAVDLGTPTSPSTCAQYANRYGPLYDYGSGENSPQTAGDIVAQGHPRSEATAAGVEIESNHWFTITQRVKIVTMGTASSEVDVWIARDGEARRLVHSWRNITLGTENSGHDSIWFLPYETNRLSNTKGQDTFVCYDELICSLNDIADPTASESLLTELPAWFQNQTESRWLAIDTRLSDIDPEDSASFNPSFPSNAPWHAVEGQPGVIDDWCGAVASPTSLLIVAQGGHGGYAGNEAYELDLTAESPAWEMLEPPSTSVQAAVQYYSDGKPSSRHGAGDQCFIPAGVTNGNRWFGLGYSSYDNNGNGANFSECSSFRMDTLNYDAQNFFTDNPDSQGAFSTLAWDWKTKKIWKVGRQNLADTGIYSFDPAANTWSAELGGEVLDQGDCTAAIDPIRHVYVKAADSVLMAWDLDSPATAHVALTTSGTGPGGSAIGFVFDPVSGCFLAWNGGATVYKLTPPLSNLNWRTATWVWSSLTNAGGGATPTSVTASGGTFGRFQYISALRALVVVNGTEQTPYVYKLPRIAV